jgi:hypothetical protein
MADAESIKSAGTVGDNDRTAAAMVNNALWTVFSAYPWFPSPSR